MTETVRRDPASDSVIQIGYAAYPVLIPASSVGDGLRTMVASGVRSLRIATQRGAPDRPDTVHRFRIGLRRLRSVLSTFGTVLPDDERRWLNQRLGSVARLYAPAREWDVFLSGTLRPLAESLPDEPALIELDTAARAARRQALPAEIDLRHQAQDVVTAIEHAQWLQQPSGAHIPDWDRTLTSFAGEILAKRHRRLRKHLKTVDIVDQQDFHGLRVEIKKLRYPIEMVANLFGGKAVDAYLERLVEVQDTLGHLNDALVAGERLAQLGVSSRAQGVMSGWLAHEAAAERARFPHAAKRLRKAEPFWAA